MCNSQLRVGVMGLQSAGKSAFISTVLAYGDPVWPYEHRLIDNFPQCYYGKNAFRDGTTLAIKTYNSSFCGDRVHLVDTPGVRMIVAQKTPACRATYIQQLITMSEGVDDGSILVNSSASDWGDNPPHSDVCFGGCHRLRTNGCRYTSC
jgi:hypothetical protein